MVEKYEQPFNPKSANLGNPTIESHQSFFTNRRLDLLFMTIDKLGIVSSNTLQLSNIMAYYNACEQVFITVKDIILPEDVQSLEVMRKKYYYILELIQSKPKCRTRKALEMLLACGKELNSGIISALQKYSYFFRMGSKQMKGLKNVTFFDHNSVFGKRRGDHNEVSEPAEGQV